MQIEKPKSTLPVPVLVLGLIIAIFVLSLPFVAKSAKSKNVTPQLDQTSPAQSDSETSPKNDLPAQEFEKALAENPTEPPALPVDDKPALAVPIVALSEKPAEPIAADKTVPSTAAASVKPQVPAKDPVAVLTSFYGDVKVIGPNGLEKTEKNRRILKGETIEVGATGEAVLELEELYVLRLKSSSKLTQLEPKRDEAFSGKERVTYRFKLDQGALLGTTKYRGEKVNLLDLIVKDKTYNIQDSTFRVQLADAAPWIGVLRGSVKSDVEKNSTQKPLVIHALEKVDLTDKPVAAEAPLKVSEAEWGLLRETYEMNMKSAAEEALQLDLSKRAGNFFDYVFDHGTFYTENVGYTVRDFYEDKASGEVYLEAEYDVFPANSFVGLYVLTRDLDTRNYSGLRFDVRRKPDEGYPDRFYLEIKSKGQIIHRFEITDIKPEWQTRQIDFFNPISTPITEVTLVFLNESIGQTKKGFIQMRHVEMIPLTGEQKAQREEADKNPTPTSGPKILPNAPKSVKQAIVTLPELKKAKKIVKEVEGQPVPYQTDTSKKIAQEVPKVVSFDDLSQ